MQEQSSPLRQPLSDDESDLRWSTKARCHAVMAELDARVICWDSVQTILEGAAEDIKAAT